MIYILHFNTPLHHARHYVGYTREGLLEERLKRHRSGRGSRLMYAIELAGIDYQVVLTHPGGRNFERRIKRAKNTPRLCPLCRQSKSTLKSFQAQRNGELHPSANTLHPTPDHHTR